MATKPRARRRSTDAGLLDVRRDIERGRRDHAEIVARRAATDAAPLWLPNWKDPSRYPDPRKETAPDRWAWEFLRRNRSYQEIFSKASAAPGSADYETVPVDSWAQTEPPALPGETLLQWRQRVSAQGNSGRWTRWEKVAQETFGLRTIRDPKSSEPPLFTRLGCALVPGQRGDLGLPIASAQPNGPHEVFFKLDLRAPLAWQIKHVSQIFEEMAAHGQRSGEFQRIAPRERYTIFRQCLQALDGQTYGVKRQQIADALFPRAGRPSYRLKKIDVLLSRARFYRDEGYRFLIEVLPVNAAG